MTVNGQTPKPWYKEPWPWLLMSGPAIVVVAAFVTLWLAASNSSDLVSDDYYKDGKHIDLDIKRDTAAIERGINAQVLISPDGSAVRVYLSGRFATLPPTQPWYVRLEDTARIWRVENKWITGQGGSVSLAPVKNLTNAAQQR